MEDVEHTRGVLHAVPVFDHISAEDMKKEQQKELILGLVCPYIIARKKLRNNYYF